MTTADNDQLTGVGGQRSWLNRFIIGSGLKALGCLIEPPRISLGLQWLKPEGCGVGYWIGLGLRRHALHVGRYQRCRGLRLLKVELCAECRARSAASIFMDLL